jgi:hypothetical protein
MKNSRVISLISLLIVLATSLLTLDAKAGTYIIEFGDGCGDSYAPNYLLLNEGDVIVLRGDFAKHPLHFDSVPDGVQLPTDIVSGTSFAFPLTAGGFYHFSSPGSKLVGLIAVQHERISVDVDAPEHPISVYPNPTIKVLHIRTGDGSNNSHSFSLANSRGQTFKMSAGSIRSSNGEFTLDLSDLHLPSGVYLLQYSSEGNIFTRKIILE